MQSHAQQPPSSEGMLTVRRLPDRAFEELWIGLRLPDEQKEQFLGSLDLFARMARLRVSQFKLGTRRVVVLRGPRGTGKTSLAVGGTNYWAWTREVEAQLVQLNLHTLASAERGGTEKNIRALFKSLREVAANGRLTFVHADELETIATDRRIVNPTTNPMDTIFGVNALIRELDALVLEQPNVVLLFTSNLPDLCDPAVLDRVDVAIHLPLPGEKERLHILVDTLEEVNRSGLCTAPTLVAAEWHQLLDATEGMSARQLRHLVFVALTLGQASELTFPQLLRAAQTSAELLTRKDPIHGN